jgi:hypothetical protein
MSEFKDSSRARARSIVRFSILPTIAAAFETHPEFDVVEVLRVCETPTRWPMNLPTGRTARQHHPNGPVSLR